MVDLEKSKIILTRPAEKFSPVNGPHCFEYVNVPLTETIPRSDIHEIMTSIKNYDPKILVFTSTVGVDIFFSFCRKPNPEYIFVAIGTSTLKRIESHRFHGVCPEVMDSSGLGRLIFDIQRGNERVALLRSNRSGKELPELLASGGIDFMEFTLYDILEVKNNKLEDFIMKNKVFGIIVTSSLEASILAKFHREMINDRNIVLFPIGVPTERAMISAGFKNFGIKGESNVEMLIHKIEKENCTHSGEWI